MKTIRESKTFWAWNTKRYLYSKFKWSLKIEMYALLTISTLDCQILNTANKKKPNTTTFSLIRVNNI